MRFGFFSAMIMGMKDAETDGERSVDGVDRIMECIPNFSEGRDLEKVEKLAGAFRAKEGVKLLDYSTDKDHNRCVVTAVGEPEALRDAVVEAIGVAVAILDMRVHDGQHPRMGAADVVPFVPVRGCTLEDADRTAKEAAAAAADRFGLPVFLYEKSATAPHRENLANIRKGQFEGMAEKIKDPLWKPDFGPDTIHPTAGVTAIGARMPLVAFNINLNTSDLHIADEIARRIRHINGGFRYVKSMGVILEDRNIAQVSINMTDYTRTSLYRVFETVKMEARRWGVNVVGSEIIGLTPMAALVDCAEYYLRIENFRMDQILETRL